MPSQAHAGAAQEAPDIGQWEGQDIPLVRPSSCNVKGGIPSSRRYLPTYLPVCCLSCCPRASRPSVRSRSFCVARLAVGCCLVVASPPPFCVLRFFLPPLRSLCFLFPCLRPRCLSLSLLSGPGCLGPWRCALRFFFPPASPVSVRSRFFFFFLLGRWLLLGAWCPPPPSFVSGWFRRCRSLPPFFCFFFPCVRPRCLWLSLVSGPGCPGPWRCVLFALWASRFSAVCALSFFLYVSPGRWLLPGGCCPPTPPAAWCSVLFFFFALCAPVVSGFLWFLAPGALGLGAARCLLCWPPASRLSVRSRLFRASRLAVGCSPVVAAPPPPFLCLAVFVASARCCVPCVVLCCVSRVAVLRCAAARCVARCCAVVCCVVLLRSVGAAARRAVPSGAPRRPGDLCFAALCFVVFPRAVCVLSLRGGVCCCSPLCSVLCVSWGAVLCVPCPLRSVRCCASLCWCACVVLFVWCVLLLAPDAVVRCRVLCCFPWCAVVRCWVWWPVVVCWCRAVAPCCPLSFAGGVGLCLFPVCAVLCCAARRVVRFRLSLRCCRCLVLWRVPVCCGVSLGVLRCGGAALVCRGVLLCCALSLWCPAPCAVSCSALLPCGVVLVGCAVRLSALLVFVFPFVLFSFAKNPCCFSVPLKTF